MMATMEDALTGRINKMNGGAAPSQADTMTIAKRLLGPGLADRYGDVIGARPTGLQDVLRDFSIGMASKDPTKADQLKMQVQDSYRQELRREETAAHERDAENRRKVGAFFEILKSIPTIPKEFRKDYIKESFGALGMPVESPLAMKILSSPETFEDGSYDLLYSEEMVDLAFKDPEQFITNAKQAGIDGKLILDSLKGLQSISKSREETQRVILDQDRKRAQAEKYRRMIDPTGRERAMFIRQAALKVDPVTGERLAPEQVMALADQYYPQAAPAMAEPAGLPQMPLSESAQVSGIGMTEAPIGIPQETAVPAAPPSDAVAAAKARLGLE